MSRSRHNQISYGGRKKRKTPPPTPPPLLLALFSPPSLSLETLPTPVLHSEIAFCCLSGRSPKGERGRETSA
ncbi:unnamed protein product [Spirodela intermedia]|uniref:Uncharacterized protein n=1 Tax=Spirodela intermedia TaxID=51605 RepID=A0A7I8KW78_SPIIN|nr:unnamed protein product [Spirodela intermedia]